MKKTSSKQFYIQMIINIVMAGMFIVSIFFFVDVAQEIMVTYQLRQQLDLVKVQYQAVIDENEALKDQKGKLTDPEYVKNYARAGYMLSKEGEQIFFLPQPSNND
ncbi:MAG: septum formation initiator family protein [Erysipelotrichia bacterium]|jgi:cell division protein DivIC|nr:septum formation initiator family protein [Erysipelotrichia bacterium]